jgi:hypothetical protein
MVLEFDDTYDQNDALHLFLASLKDQGLTDDSFSVLLQDGQVGWQDNVDGQLAIMSASIVHGSEGMQ